MGIFTQTSVFFAVILIVTFGVFQVYGDHGCHTDEDCGGAPCNPNTGECSCRKDEISIPEAKPMCQKQASIGQTCKYQQQCVQTAGELSDCVKNKCECKDTVKNRDHVWEYKGTCYRATDVDGKCTSELQCQASIVPHDAVTCKPDSDHGNSGKCECREEKKCSARTNAGVRVYNQGVAVVSIASVIVIALKIVL